MTPTELAELDADRDRARRVFVCWLVLATALTLAGNSAAAMLDHLPPLAIRLAVHLLPPVVALIGFHALTALARAGAIHRARKGVVAAVRDAGAVYAGAVVGVFGILTIAAVMSYAGLIEVARVGGMTAGLAAVWPLHIDLGIAVCSTSLLVLRPISAADQRAAKRAASTTATNRAASAPFASPTSAEPATPARESQFRAEVSHARQALSTTPDASGAAVVESQPATVDDSATSPAVTQDRLDHAALLQQRGTVAKPVEEIATVLSLLDVPGVSERRIASLTGWSTNTIAKVRKATTAADSEPA